MYRFSYSFNVEGGSHKNIHYIFSQYGVPFTYVEVGIFEGSTIFHVSDTYTPYNTKLQLIGIDPHVGSIDMDEHADITAKYFQHNLGINKHKNVEYIRKHSTQGLIDLINRNQSAEFIYIDGDHRADQVLTDIVLSWKIIPSGGVILCDDTGNWKFTDDNGNTAAQMAPRMAVEFFIQCNWHNLDIINLPYSGQTAIRKK